MQDRQKFNYEYFTDGEVIFEEGSLGMDIFFIVSGKVEVSHFVDYEKKVMAILQKGDFFGEMAPLTNNVRSMTVKAVGDLYVYKLSLDEMLDYIRENPELLREMCVSFAKRLQDTDLKVKELSMKTFPGGGEERTERITGYLRKKLEEKDKQIESLRKRIEFLQERLSRSY